MFTPGKKSIFLAMALFALAMCGRAATTETSFKEVTSKLDPGGSLFLYYSMDNAIKQTVETYESVKNMILLNSTMSPQEQMQAESVIKIFETYMNASGLKEINAIGFSSIMTGKDMYRGRVYVYHLPNQNSGYIWNAFGNQPKEFSTLKSMPEDTVFAYGLHLTPSETWEWIKQQSINSASPEAGMALMQLEHEFKKNNKDLNLILKSLSGEFGVILTASETAKATIDIEGKSSITIPEPQLAIILGTNNDTLFNEIKNSGIFIPEKDNPELLNFPMPTKYPFLKPVITSQNGYLYLASNPSIIKSIQATLSSGKGMISTPYFKTLSQGVPLKGNAFKFVNKKFATILNDVIQQFAGLSAKPVMISTIADIEHFGMMERTDNGFIATLNSNVDPSVSLLSSTLIAPSAIAAGALLPALNSARQRAREVSSLNNLKQVGLGIFMFADDHSNKMPDTLADLQKGGYIQDEIIFKCPVTDKPYIYAGKDLKLPEIKNPSTLPLVFSVPTKTGNAVVLFADGHVMSERQAKAKTCVELVEYLNKKYNLSKDYYEKLLSEAKKVDGAK